MPPSVPASGDSPPSWFDRPVPETLIAHARLGQQAAQAELYRLFERPVYSLLRRLCACPDTAADLLQDSFLLVFERLDQYRGEAPFGRWLRSIAATQGLMQLRAGRRLSLLFTRWDDTDETQADPAPDPLAGQDLETALVLLEPLPRAVLWLYHVEGYTHAEIGRLCGGRTPSFSKSQLSRAHQRLRAAFGIAQPAGAPSVALAGEPT